MSANKLLANATRDELLEEIRLLGIAFNEEFEVKAKAQKEVGVLQNALKEIAKGAGRYSKDPLTHAGNTIEDMVKLASDALLNVQHKSDFEKYGIDLSVLSENQLKHLKDYHQAILESVV